MATHQSPAGTTVSSQPRFLPNWQTQGGRALAHARQNFTCAAVEQVGRRTLLVTTYQAGELLMGATGIQLNTHYKP